MKKITQIEKALKERKNRRSPNRKKKDRERNSRAGNTQQFKREKKTDPRRNNEYRFS